MFMCYTCGTIDILVQNIKCKTISTSKINRKIETNIRF